MNIPTADLRLAYEGSYYTILGCGEPLDEWVAGYTDMMRDRVGVPIGWVQTTGAAINQFARTSGVDIRPDDRFAAELIVLMFPLDGLDRGVLPIFKLTMEDRWFDDVVDNMRRNGDDGS